MNNPKYIYFPFLRLLYYIRGLIGVITALMGIAPLISGEQEIYQYILSVVATSLFFFLARFFTEENCCSKIPLLFFVFSVKEFAELILTVVLKSEKHLPSTVSLFFLTFIFYIIMALLCRFRFKSFTLKFLIYVALFCLCLTPVISFWGIIKNAFLQGEPQIISISFSFLGTVLGTLCNFGTVYISATRKTVCES